MFYTKENESQKCPVVKLSITYLPDLLQEKAYTDLSIVLHRWIGKRTEHLPGEFLPGHVVEFFGHPTRPGEVVTVVRS